MGGSGLHSTANDLLKYLSANLGLTPSSLTPLMKTTHEVHFESMRQNVKVGLGWGIASFPQGTEFVMHGGGTPGYITFIGFDPNRQRGVVILTSSEDFLDVDFLGMFLLDSEWQPDQRPTAVKIGNLDYGSYVGEYQLSPNLALGILALREVLVNVTKMAVGIAAGVSLAGLLLVVLLGRIAIIRRLRTRLVLRWRAFRFRTRCSIWGGAVLAGVLSAVMIVLVAAHLVWAQAHPVVDIHREGDRLFVQCTGSTHFTSNYALPHITGELLPESETRFFERLSGIPVTFFRDARGKVTRLAASLFGVKLSSVKISDQLRNHPNPRWPSSWTRKFATPVPANTNFHRTAFFTMESN